MSKINQIQQALQEMDGGKFQKLADAYLTERGFRHINSIGSVVAAKRVFLEPLARRYESRLRA
jgi:HJR/Mrr/RecB family endonuclease